MDIATLKTVVLVARHGSFAAAARALDVDPSSVSRMVAGVEAELGVRLFQRSTRRLSVTELGARYIAEITPLLEEMDRALDTARSAAHAPSGTLKMTASVAFAQECIVPRLGQFMARYPAIAIELIPTDDMLDLTAKGIDLAIRLTPAPRGDLISTRLMDTRYVVCASPAYIAGASPLTEPGDLRHHRCLRFALPDYRTRWRFRRAGKAPFAVDITGDLVIANALALRRAARDGLGPSLLADWLVGPDIAAGRLVDVFPQYDCSAAQFDTAAWALYPSRSYLPQKVRVMIDFLRQS
ncbi:DNA-binding transcriptional LysR family regulator [Rubricella aquisinus]|uniref:DNA-binding transcriptional LysR family regulator n=1 Tax=Rubricella aquisinus TaxID=2028108 RepID=A0A840X173_9RHOB|nr:LysR family transcriptional regulator [Rubricella aquisinus]MBB5515626.1 DNA-binding transcriptional LysR family regulator [Rubricella aquisinus]